MKEQTMKRQHITFPFVLAHAWVLMILFGALVFDTLIVYPNTFHDVPRSLERAMAFATVRGPGDFFPPLGFASWITGIGSLILAWRIKPARYWVLASLVVIACEGLFSMAFFWPRNTIMFTGRHGDPFRCFPEADRQGIRGGTLDTVRAGRGCGSDLVHGVPEILPVQDLVPVCSSRGAGSRWRTLECLNRVGVEGHRYGGVAQEVLDDLVVNSRREEQRDGDREDFGET